MILADTSIWADHLRDGGDSRMEALLDEKRICMHPFVIGELALGYLRPRARMIALFKQLPEVMVVDDEEALVFIEQHVLFGTGIGYVDAHLLASARLDSAKLWTRDKRLQAVAAKLGLAV